MSVVRAVFTRSWSLRGRVLLGILATLALVSVSVAVLSVVALRGFLLAQLDDQVGLVLQRSEWTLSSQLGGPTVGAPPGLGTAQGSGTLGLVAVDGTLLQPQYYDERARLRTIAEQPQARLTDVAADGLARSVDLGADLGTYRVVRVPIADRIDLIAGLPQRQVDDTVSQLTGFVTGVTALGLVVAAAVGALVVRVALRPLRRVTATAGRVAELPLDRGEVALAERVPDTDPHTEVGQLGSALNRMLEHVDAALTARQRSEGRLRRFVADASHELRTPLASIRGYSEHAGHVGRDSTVPLPIDITHSLGRIESESVRMSELVDELLLLARLDAGIELECRAVDVESLLVDAVADAAIAGPDHEWSLDAHAAGAGRAGRREDGSGDDSPGGGGIGEKADAAAPGVASTSARLIVAGDPARLQQAVANLLANARLHTPAGTRVEVEASLDVAGRQVRISVTDDGPGIDPALLPTLFERFVRGDESRSRQAGGTGLGLSIARAIIERHSGSVDAESVPGRTRFDVLLPAADGVVASGLESASRP